jgi:hypothetical protein
VLGVRRWRELVKDREKWRAIVRQAKAHTAGCSANGRRRTRRSLIDVKIRSALLCVASVKVSVSVHHYTTLHYTTLHYTTLHYIASQNTVIFCSNLVVKVHQSGF